MNNDARKRIAELANAEGGRVFPTLTAYSDHATLCQWLQACDPNGCHTQEAFQMEGGKGPSHGGLDGAWEALAEMLACEDEMRLGDSDPCTVCG